MDRLADAAFGFWREGAEGEGENDSSPSSLTPPLSSPPPLPPSPPLPSFPTSLPPSSYYSLPSFLPSPSILPSPSHVPPLLPPVSLNRFQRTPRSKPRRPPGPRSLCPRLCQHPPAEGDQPGADGQLGPTPPQGPDAGQRQTPGPLDPSHVALLALALCVLGSASTLPRREISREQTVTSARLLRKALTQVNAKLLSHLGLEGSHQPSICLPPVERSSAGWYRYPGLAGARFCLYRKCLRRLEATLLRKYGFGLDSTPLGLGLLIGCLGHHRFLPGASRSRACLLDERGGRRGERDP
ncbi:WW domain-binding protein 11-like [Mobula hypostoma]|uniref:WW domain-binding protein 11-like n=1 Tax=Mobula hypostoma TaxID=723540 RepID=UPI002FC3C6B9